MENVWRSIKYFTENWWKIACKVGSNDIITCCRYFYSPINILQVQFVDILQLKVYLNRGNNWHYIVTYIPGVPLCWREANLYLATYH